MANNLLYNPWILDTVANIDTSSIELRVRGIKWVAATTAGHTAVIKSGDDSHVIWEDVCPGSNYVAYDTLGDQRGGIVFHGFRLTALGSGRLYIYFAGV